MLTHKGTKTIKTDRLILRKYRKTDAKDVFEAWTGDKAVTRYMTFTPHESKEQTADTLEKWCTLYTRDNVYLWAIQMGDKVIGNINVVTISNTLESCEVGYCLGVKYWGQGIMTEAAQAVIDFLFRQVGVNRIELSHAVGNPSSGRVAEKCGMKYEGTKREAFKSPDGKFCDLKCYGIVKSDWQKIDKNKSN